MTTTKLYPGGMYLLEDGTEVILKSITAEFVIMALVHGNNELVDRRDTFVATAIHAEQWGSFRYLSGRWTPNGVRVPITATDTVQPKPDTWLINLARVPASAYVFGGPEGEQ